jgi:hypothetical protein
MITWIVFREEIIITAKRLFNELNIHLYKYILREDEDEMNMIYRYTAGMYAHYIYVTFNSITL